MTNVNFQIATNPMTVISTSTAKKVKFASGSLRGLKNAVLNRKNNALNKLNEQSNSVGDGFKTYIVTLSRIGCNLLNLDLSRRAQIVSKSRPIKLKPEFVSNIKYKSISSSSFPGVVNEYKNSFNENIYSQSNVEDNKIATNYQSSDLNPLFNEVNSQAVEQPEFDRSLEEPKFDRNLEEGKIISKMMDLEEEKRKLSSSDQPNSYDSQLEILRRQRDELRNLPQGVELETEEQKNYKAIQQLMKEGIPNKDIIDSALNDDEKMMFWSLINKIESRMELENKNFGKTI